jgi:hypothetical protein
VSSARTECGIPRGLIPALRSCPRTPRAQKGRICATFVQFPHSRATSKVKIARAGAQSAFVRFGKTFAFTVPAGLRIEPLGGLGK